MNDAAELYFDLHYERANDGASPIELNILMGLAHYHLKQGGCEGVIEHVARWGEDLLKGITLQ